MNKNKISSIIFLLFLFLNSTICISAQPSLRERFNKDINHVFLLEKTGKPGEAIKYWESVKSTYGNRDGRYEDELGKLLARNASYERAEKVLIGGIQLDGGYPYLYQTLAMVYRELGKLDKAEDYAQKAIKKFPKWAGGYRMLGLLYLDQKMYSKAANMEMHSVEFEPNLVAYTVLATARYRLNDYEGTVIAFNAAIKLSTDVVKMRDEMLMYVISLDNVGLQDEAVRVIEAYKKITGRYDDSGVDQIEKDIRAKLKDSK